jgi:riboflavin synthase alpha subunit
VTFAANETHCSGVSVTVAADEPPKIFAHLIRYDTHRDAATSISLAKPCSGVSVTVDADEPPKIFAHLIRFDTHRDAATSDPLASNCSGVSVTVAADETPKIFAHLIHTTLIEMPLQAIHGIEL